MKRSCGLEIITLNRRLKIIIVILLYSCTQSFNFKYNFYLICHPYQYAFSVFAKSSLSADFSIVETGSYYHCYCKNYYSHCRTLSNAHSVVIVPLSNHSSGSQYCTCANQCLLCLVSVILRCVAVQLKSLVYQVLTP